MKPLQFLVEGRRFSNRLHAITFAQRLAEESDRSVDVKVETRDVSNVVRRTWACRMHPPNTHRTLLEVTVIPQLRAVAV